MWFKISSTYMKWNNKVIIQTGMVEINAEQCQDRKESNQVW